jgi:thiamine biosynthesis protein ThiI
MLVRPDRAIVRFSEIALKGGNRRMFEDILQRNLKCALGGRDAPRVRRAWGRFVVGPVEDAALAARIAARVFGVSSVSVGVLLESSQPIAPAAAGLVGAWLADRPGEGPVSFRVTARRADKRTALTSQDVARAVGEALRSAHPRLVARMKGPELTVGIDVRAEGTYLFLDKEKGVGGLPVDSQAKVMTLLSGGIDSPVAAWLAMKRGCRVDFCHVDSFPFTGTRSVDKVLRLAGLLNRWQGRTRCWVVPFANVQVAVKEAPPADYRTVVYRRFMTRIACRLAAREECLALVTGDSIGQVASQTLENIAAADACADRPVLRPLVALDKEEIIAQAQRIGTFAVSIEPHDDCCTVFQPENPAVRAKAHWIERVESQLDVEGLVSEAVEKTRAMRYLPDPEPSHPWGLVRAAAERAADLPLD